MISISQLGDLPQIATIILNQSYPQKIFLFYGEMGAGKTTLIKELCTQLGVREQASSPTFSIVNNQKKRGKEMKCVSEKRGHCTIKSAENKSDRGES